MDDKPLLDIAEPKRPIILYVIIGIQFIAIITLIIVLAVHKCDECKKCEECNCPEVDPIPQPIPYNTEHFIPINESFYTNRTEGSNALQGKLNHFDSPYFKMVDIYNMKSNSNRTIFSNFKTYQQTTEFSAQCADLIMVLEYYGDKAPSERQCMMDFIEVTDPDNFEISKEDYLKFNMKNYENYINSLGYKTTSNDDYEEGKLPFSDSKTFSKWAREILNKNETIVVNWADWGGACSIIIGIDTMGHESPEDHVIIFADSYDTTDHLNDGYYIVNLDKFYFNWIYNKIFYLIPDYEQYATGRFIVIHRKEGN